MPWLEVCYFTVDSSCWVRAFQSCRTKIILQNSSLKKLGEWCSVGVCWLRENPCTYMSSADASDHKACDSVSSSYRMIRAWAPLLYNRYSAVDQPEYMRRMKNNLPCPSCVQEHLCTRCVCVCMYVCVHHSHLSFWCCTDRCRNPTPQHIGLYVMVHLWRNSMRDLSSKTECYGRKEQ